MALRLNPDSSECHFNIATAYNQKQQHAQATVHFETALQFNPGNSECHYELGKLSVLKGSDFELKRAVHFFEKAIQLNPKHSKALAALKELPKGSFVSGGAIEEEEKQENKAKQ